MMQSNKRTELAFQIGREEQLDGAVASIAGAASGDFLDLSDKLWIEAQAGAAKWYQRNRRGSVGRRGKHTGPSPGGFTAGHIFFEQGNTKALLRQAQGDG